MTEKLEILNMIKEGRISPDEGARLLEAIERADNTDRPTAAGKPATRWLVIEATTKHGERIKSLPPIRIPISMIRLFFRFIPKDYQLPGSSVPGPDELMNQLEERRPLELRAEKDGWSIRITAE